MKQDLTVLATTGQPSSTQPYANAAAALERQLKEHQKGVLKCTR